MTSPTHILNWHVGWWSILFAFITGAAFGIFFHRADWMGGYDSWRRRITRLGHIALAALGFLNVLYALSPWPVPGTREAGIASWGLVIGNLTMPLVCFLCAWKMSLRFLFFIPVLCLVAGVWNVLCGAR